LTRLWAAVEIFCSAPAAAPLRLHGGDILLHKHRFDVFSNDNGPQVLDILNPVEITLYCVALDVCNKAAVPGLLAPRPEIPLSVVTDGVKPVDVVP